MDYQKSKMKCLDPNLKVTAKCAVRYQRIYSYDLRLVQKLSEASGVSGFTIKSNAVLLAKTLGIEWLIMSKNKK